jgi:cell division protein ZapA (FtsZ GTPase activity inhibitor)
MKSVEVEIFGKKYRLRSDTPQKVNEYAGYLNSLLEDISSKYGIVDNKDSLTLAAMILTEKIFELTDESEQLKKEIDSLNTKISSFFLDLDIVEKQ